MAKYTQYVCARAFRLKLRFGVRNLSFFLTARKMSHGSGGPYCISFACKVKYFYKFHIFVYFAIPFL